MVLRERIELRPPAIVPLILNEKKDRSAVNVWEFCVVVKGALFW